MPAASSMYFQVRVGLVVGNAYRDRSIAEYDALKPAVSQLLQCGGFFEEDSCADVVGLDQLPEKLETSSHCMLGWPASNSAKWRNSMHILHSLDTDVGKHVSCCGASPP